MYFGEKQSDGNQDIFYQDNVNEILLHTNDIIFFFVLMYHDLQHHGERIRTKLEKLYFGRESIPGLTSGNLYGAKAFGLLPPDFEYDGWLFRFQLYSSDAENIKQRPPSFHSDE